MKLFSILVLSIFFLFENAFAAESHRKIEDLVRSIEVKRAFIKKRHAAAGSIVNFFFSPEAPRQGDSVSAFIQTNTSFEDQEILVEAMMDGVPVAARRLGDELWTADLGVPTLIKSYEVKAIVKMQNREDARLLREALAQVESEILDLNDRISNETDPAIIAQLEAQRAESIAIRDQVVGAIAALVKPVGEQKSNLSVRSAAPSNPNFPKITGVFPNLLKADLGGTLTIHGLNFGDSPQVFVGGVELSVSSSSMSEIVATVPMGLSEGAKHVEVKFNQGGKIKNAIMSNGLFITLQNIVAPIAPPTPPVAVVSAPASVNLGLPASLSAGGSYDLNNQPLAYEWRILSKPNGSMFPIGGPALGTASTFQFSPDLPGHYVVELRVAETTAPFSASSPVVTVVQAIAPANRAPVAFAGSIVTPVNTTVTKQIVVSDADFWQSVGFYISKAGTRGTASISGTGLLTYVAGSNSGADSVEVLVVDSGQPQGSTKVSIPVTVGSSSNQIPVISGPIFRNHLARGPLFQVGMSVNGVSDPDGAISSVEWDFGDGTTEKGMNNGFADVVHNYPSAGTYNVTLKVIDNEGGQATLSQAVTVIDTDIPKAVLVGSPLSGPVPLTVNMDASGSFDADGISLYRYSWRDGSPDQEGMAARSHTFNTPGIYQVRMRVRDSNRAQSEAIVNVYAGVTPPATGSPPSARIVVPDGRHKQNPATFTLDGTESFDPNPSGGIASYAWNNGDFLSCPSTSGCLLSGASTTTSYPAPTNYFVGLTVTNSNGAVSPTKYEEVWAVNGGIAPKAVLDISQTTGVAPFSITASSAASFEYDGSIVARRWNAGVYPCPNNICQVAGQAFGHTYTNPGVYFLSLEVEDNNGNRPKASTMITVNPSYASLAKSLSAKVKALEGDPEDVGDRERERTVLAGACASGAGSACYQLSVMYAQDGDEFTATQLKARSCSLGYQLACGI